MNYVQELGGILSLEDLKGYHSQWRKPITFNYKNYTVSSMPLPSSGGICLAQILKNIKPYHIEQYAHNGVEYIQLLVEAERRAYADRAYYMGDPDFVKVPVEELLSAEYNSTLGDVLETKHQVYETKLLCPMNDRHQKAFIHTDCHSEVHIVVKLDL